ncbi:hypothetical protein RFI_05107 [Reticulomyxa filosa]|uniref:Uncharacterized protein n=1 Tax=Reticulomyxa filosa TaxID=46433 RepID=X6P365_RETFI|nr:hypothetical protein RFI_05107 [Reticulomyxa filosa]|eukprot:ETO32007.1 hypothetical protein RFI_05107 [Reticulomyxa filosa]
MHKIPSVAPIDFENIAKGMYKDKRQDSNWTKTSISENDIELLVDVFKELSGTRIRSSLTFGETNLIGTRDFYALIRHYLETRENPRQSFEGVMRNLGGYKGREYQDPLTDILQKMSGLRKEQVLEKMNCWGALQCIKANLNNIHCRHCLLICEKQHSWQLLLDHDILPYDDVVFLFESQFPADLTASTNYDHLQKVSNCMAAGKKVVLFNLKSIHECLYDMLNQRYQINRQGQNVCGMSVDSRSRECIVADTFRCIVVIREESFNDPMQKAFFHRFEKQWISYRKSLPLSLTKKAEAFQKYLCKIYDTSNQELSSLFCGFNEDTIPSAISCALPLESLSSTDSKNEELKPNEIDLLHQLFSPLLNPEKIVDLCIHKRFSNNQIMPTFFTFKEVVSETQELCNSKMLLILTFDEMQNAFQRKWDCKRVEDYAKVSHFEQDVKQFFTGSDSDKFVIRFQHKNSEDLTRLFQIKWIFETAHASYYKDSKDEDEEKDSNTRKSKRKKLVVLIVRSMHKLQNPFPLIFTKFISLSFFDINFICILILKIGKNIENGRRYLWIHWLVNLYFLCKIYFKTIN